MSEERRADPLAGQRAAINDRETEVLTWPDIGQGCPVNVGEVFKLSTCHIEITRTQRNRSGQKWTWVARFVRHSPTKVYILSRGAGADGHGYVHDEEAAMRAQDDPDASTIASVDPLDNPENLRPPPEPEAVPPDEVATLPSTVAARARFEEQRREDALRRLRRSVVEELREALKVADEGDIDRVREVIAELRAAA